MTAAGTGPALLGSARQWMVCVAVQPQDFTVVTRHVRELCVTSFSTDTTASWKEQRHLTNSAGGSWDIVGVTNPPTVEEGREGREGRGL